MDKIPEPPLGRVIKEGIGHFCPNCHSTMSKSGWLGLFGERLCDNEKCPYSKKETKEIFVIPNKCYYLGEVFNILAIDVQGGYFTLHQPGKKRGEGKFFDYVDIESCKPIK